jgi:putative nucleotidyltransferase with HDIG domain
MPRDTANKGGATRAGVLARRGIFGQDRHISRRLLDSMFRAPTTTWAVLIWGLFVVVCGSLANWTRQQPLVAVGRVMNTTAVVRTPIYVEDLAQTEQKRSQARQNTPRVYRLAPGVMGAIRSSIENLPRTLENARSLGDVIPEVQAQFKLTEEGLAAIRGEVANGEVSGAWRDKTQRLMDALRRRPFLDDGTFQRENQEGASSQVELRDTDSNTATERSMRVSRGELVSTKDERQLAEVVRRMAEQAGFAEPALTVVVGRLTTNPEPTYQFDEAATTEAQNNNAAAVPTIVNETKEGQILFRRGSILAQQQFDQYKQELRAFVEKAQAHQLVLRRMSVFGAVAAIAFAIAGYLCLFCPRVYQNPGRSAGVAIVMVGAVLVSCLGTVMNPALITMTAVAPVVFVAVLLVVAYDQRVALAIGSLQGVLTCIALDQPIGMYALMLTGVSVAVMQLREIRDRRGIIRMGLFAALALAIATILVALIDRPIVEGAIRMTLVDAAIAGAGGLAVGVLTLALLPTIERAFDITTGMTLIELRDPKQPLLRQLQQRAPGTYNHSLNVASIAEAAADSIRADALLTYVGALYHDIGKMNKPEYFVENQAGGPNKHDKLSPAMSLLVIVGHVKDGMAMAEEAGLPKSIQHFIEAHHGTTLVEFFYNRARKQAEQTAKGEEPELPDEIEYRYPGPKPRTKECAILMLADAVESATRTMTEPTPSRIEALVRALANKRLMDGQFDECELTLHELQTISESISKSVASIYHGRVLYPSTAGITEREQKEEKRA